MPAASPIGRLCQRHACFHAASERLEGLPAERSPRLTGALLAAVAVFAVASLCGCGSQSSSFASKSAAEILATATSAAQKAGSVHIRSRSANGPLTLALDMSYAKNGAQGSISVFGLDYQLIRIGDTLYLSGNQRVDRQLAQTLSGRTATAVARLPAGTWLKGSATTGPLAQLAAITDMSSELALILGRRTPVTKGAERTINGQQAIELKQAAKLYSGSLFIATIGNPYPVLQRKTGRETGQTTFTGWNRPVTLTPPANATDLSQLEHRT